MSNVDTGTGLPEVTRVLDIAETYPGLPIPCVERPTQIGVLDTLMAHQFDFDAILLDGPEESGKSTVLAQFAAAHDARTICLFLRPVTEFTYDPVQIRFDLCNQITWQLFARQLDINDQPDGGQLRYLFQRLERKAAQDRRPFYFVVDGLADIPTEAQGVRKALLDMLPLGVRMFRFLIAGSPHSTGVDELPKIKVRHQQISLFSLEETQQLFAGLGLSKEQLEEIYKTCRERVGRMASIRRLIMTGLDPQVILDSLPEQAPEVFELEWRTLPLDNRAAEAILATAAHTPEVCSIDTLCSLVQLETSEVQTLVSSMPCLRIEQQGGRIAYVSESFRRYAAKRLAGIEKSVLKAAVDYLEKLAEPQDAFRVLPEYLERLGDSTGLFAYVNTKTVGDALAKSKSIAFVSARLERASVLAFSGNKYDAGVRYVIQRAALRTVLDNKTSRRQIEAALLTSGESAALELASMAFSEEERLYLLSLIARLQKARKAAPNQQALDEITRLAEVIDWRELREQAREIAVELLPVLPEVGLRVLERSIGQEDDANAVDAVIAAAFLRAAMRRDATSYRRELLQRASESSRSRETKEAFAAFATFSPKESVSELMSGVERLANTSEKVLFLRLWLETNSAHNEAIGVATKLLHLIIGDSAYAPNAATFSAIVSAVSNSREPSQDGARIVLIAEAQLPQLKNAGALSEYIRLLCELAVAKRALRVSDPAALLVPDALDLDKEDADCAARATSLAWLYSGCIRLHLGKEAADDWGLLRYTKDALGAAVTSVLNSTAEQTDALRGLIQPLSSCDLDYLIALVPRVNTEERRNDLYDAIARRLMASEFGDLDMPARIRHVYELQQRICDSESQDDLRTDFVAWISEKLQTMDALQADCPEIFALTDSIRDAEQRCLSHAALLRTIKAPEKAASEFRRLEAQISESWLAIEGIGDRIDCAFSLASKLAAGHPELARSYYAEGRRLLSSTPGMLATAEDASRFAVLLLARSLAAMERADIASNADWTRFTDIVQKIPSRLERALAWSFVTLLVARTKRDRAATIVTSNLVPLIRDLLINVTKCEPHIQFLISGCAPALWLHHSRSIDEFLRPLCRESRDDALGNILLNLLEGFIPYDAWNDPPRPLIRLTPEMATDALAILGKMEGDSAFTYGATALLERLRDRSDARINRNQRAEILRQLRDLQAQKLPQPSTGIGHDGYIVALDAYIRGVEADVSHSDWEALVQRANAVPNDADRVFVLTSVAKNIPGSYLSLRKQTFLEAISALKRLPLLEDQFDRCNYLVESAKGDLPIECKALMKDLLNQSICSDRPSLERKRRRILDSIYRLDSDAAASLSSITDSDPTRARIRTDMNLRLENLKVADRLRDADGIRVDNVPTHQLAEACWRELGFVNSTRSTSRKYKEDIEVVKAARNASHDDAYPILSFAIETTAARYEKTGEAFEYLRPFFVATAETADLVMVAASVGRGADVEAKSEISEGSASTTMVEVDSREEAMRLLRKWIEASESSYVKVCDPYLRPADIELVQIVSTALPRAEISVLTSWKAAKSGDAGSSVREKFFASWRRISGNGKPPNCQVIVAGVKSSGLFGIHNRWIILEDLGIDLGTSFGAVGGDRSHVISRLSATTRSQCETEVDRYLLMQEKFWKEERVLYDSFNLETEFE